MRTAARGVTAALVFAALSLLGPIAADFGRPAEAATLAPGETTLADGLTLMVRRLHSSPTVAVEVWLSVPSDGYGPSKPGIARLAALAVAYESFGGSSLRDLVRTDGGQISVTVYPAATEIAMIVPSYDGPAVIAAMLNRVFHPSIDNQAFSDARQRLAAQQAAYQGATELVLRDGAFAALFSSGSYHVSPYGTSSSLGDMASDDVRSFLSRGYTPGDAIFVVAGDVDQAATSAYISAHAPLPAAVSAVPASALASHPGTNMIAGAQASGSGVAMAWAGPPISDERAATAMDFLSDYLLRPDVGTAAAAIRTQNPNLEVGGEFVTLRDPGVFYVTVTGSNVDATSTLAMVRSAIGRAVSTTMSTPDFARALDAYRTHALRDNADSPQTIADNYGWYFVHGAPAYSPSATDNELAGDYYAQVASLTPQYVTEVAKRYLTSAPAVAVVGTQRPAAAQAPRALPIRGDK